MKSSLFLLILVVVWTGSYGFGVWLEERYADDCCDPHVARPLEALGVVRKIWNTLKAKVRNIGRRVRNF